MPSLRLFNKPLMEVNPSKMAQLIISSSVRKGGAGPILKKATCTLSCLNLYRPVRRHKFNEFKAEVGAIRRRSRHIRGFV